MKVSQYEGKEFLVKIAAGNNWFGLDGKNMKGLKKNSIITGDNDTLFVYDEYRFVSGIVEHEKLNSLIRQFGKLSGEKIYNKQIYFKAKLKGKNKNHLEVKTDKLYHDQGW